MARPRRPNFTAIEKVAILREGFADGRRRKATDDKADKVRLYQQTGQLTVELDWVRKALESPTEMPERSGPPFDHQERTP